MESLEAQTDKDFSVLFLDDCSTDNSDKVFKDYIKNCPHYNNEWEGYIQNDENIGIMRNVIQGVQATDDETICCILDGDDFLYPHAVETVKKAYEENDLDWGYSNFTLYPHLRPGWCRQINKDVSPRIFHPYFWTSHMRTWKAKVFKQIDYDKKFKDFNGEWYNAANDVAIMHSLFDVSKNFMYIPEQLYYHDISEGENTTRAPEKRKQQMIEEFQIRCQLEPEDMLVAQAYYKHVIIFYESILNACEKDSKFKDLLKSKGFPLD